MVIRIGTGVSILIPVFLTAVDIRGWIHDFQLINPSDIKTVSCEPIRYMDVSILCGKVSSKVTRNYADIESDGSKEFLFRILFELSVSEISNRTTADHKNAANTPNN